MTLMNFHFCRVSSSHLSATLAWVGMALALAGCAQSGVDAALPGARPTAVQMRRGAPLSASQYGDGANADAVAAPLASAAEPRNDIPSAIDDATVAAACACGKGFQQTGFASWYGRMFQGRRTASGERYDMHALTAAHRTLPLGACVRVTSLVRTRSVVVRINDRGPFVRGRIIDLSYAAAEALGVRRAGSAQVRLEHVAPVRGADGVRRCMDLPT
ncbi:septal ring lytic transglycosylase RlpA family protein [Paraburkholderia phenoliruptrix]|uniref:septal ring lytic transglycosylase RlpA family protein n=1 Tax=Paraburkholderia phenoliruptrix TaxID=252970 RepID=UPI0034CF7613